ncbi:MAG: phospholipase D family protein [Rubrobacter sp.]
MGSEQENSLFGSVPLADAPKLGVVRARFEGEKRLAFEDVLSGCDTLRVLTYSNSLSIICRAASLVEDMEIVFGREDIVGEAEKLYWHQDELLRAVRTEMEARDPLREKARAGKLRLFVVKDIISHEKLFLMEGEGMKRILTGSANLSERALGGKQNEGYVLFENDPAAWDHYEAKYEKIKAASALAVPKRALLSDELDIEDLPAFSSEGGSPIVAVEDGSPENGIVRKVVSSKTPKHFAGLSAVVPKSKGAAHLDRRARTEAIQYVKSNRRTEESNPEEYLSIDVAAGTANLSGKRLDLEVPEGEVARDVHAWVRYFEGFSVFRGESEKLARDYFAFWSWLWFGPLLCDGRNAAQARGDDVHDYPIFGILYGKSNCGKTELVDTLLRSMFGKSGKTRPRTGSPATGSPTSWPRIAGIRSFSTTWRRNATRNTPSR